jgi:hypothetical protein
MPYFRVNIEVPGIARHSPEFEPSPAVMSDATETAKS